MRIQGARTRLRPLPAPGIAAALPALVALACGSPPPAADLAQLLERGDFVPRTSFAELTQSAEEPIAFWRPRPLVPLEGWGRADFGLRPVGSRSLLEIERRTRESTDLVIDFRWRASEEFAPPEISVEPRWNGRPLEAETLTPGRTRVRQRLGAGALRDRNRLELFFDPPIEQPTSGQQSVAIERLGLLAPGEKVPRPRGRALGARSADGRLVFERAGSWVALVEMPAGARELKFEVEAPPGDRLSLLALDERGERVILVSGTDLAAGERSADVSKLAGQSVLLVFDAVLGADSKRLAVDRARVSIASLNADPSPAESGPPAHHPRERSPDVVVIVLDAARGDRFPGGGYARRTTPNIDRLAAEALVFPRAYSECANTVCSVPNLITGLPFLPVGGTLDGQRLSDEVTTLAEVLSESGYRTIAFSATPNHGSSRNLDQGYDEFFALWGRPKPDHGPYLLSRSAAEVLAAQPSDEPLFLMLHYLPPHQPYEPAPRFDRFTIPGYRGPVVPGMSLRPYSLGEASLPEADLRQLIGLYDGNLLMADDAVQQVFEAMRSSGRWNNSVIVITSDHGEAFMEHGRQGHNSTLFDEMLHVPLIIRLPGGERPEVDTERPVQVGDVFPTVLGVLGIEPPTGLGGIDLLADEEGTGPRTLFARTGHSRFPMLSARTDRWKLIVWPRHGDRMLFDLEADPAERENLAARRPLVFAQLALRLRNHLERTAGAAQGEAAELSDAEREVLRSLGYVD